MMRLPVVASVAVAWVAVLGIVLEMWGRVRPDHQELLRADLAISRVRSWRMRIIESHPSARTGQIPNRGSLVVEAILPDREHAWQHVDSYAGGLDSTTIRTLDQEYIRIGDDRYFRGGRTPSRPAAPTWIRLEPRDMPPVGGLFELRFHLTNPRTIGYSFDWVETTVWSVYHRALLRVNGLNTYSGHACREWICEWQNKEGPPMRDTLCIGVADHLPHHLTMSGGGFEVDYEWDPPIVITVPVVQ